MAALTTEYKRLEGLVRKKRVFTGGRGRGYATVAKEYLFSQSYTRADGTPATKETCPGE